MRIETPNFAFMQATFFSDRVIPTLKEGRPLTVNSTPTQKIGIKVYNCVLGWILSLFGVAVSLKDACDRIYYVNKNSLIAWTSTNGSNQTNTWRDLNQLLQYILSDQELQEVKDLSKIDPYDTETECGICYTDFPSIELECKHKYCVTCIKDWVKKNEFPTCPEDQGKLTANDLIKINA